MEMEISGGQTTTGDHMNTSLRRLFSFNGGVKPDYHKEASTALPIAVPPAPTFLVIPLHQNIGGTPRPCIEIGQQVLKGQRIGEADGDVSSAVHASTSGTIVAIEMRRMPHPSGLRALCVVLQADGNDRWIDSEPFDFKTAHQEVTRSYLRDAGIVGLGGAVFPSHLKLNPGQRGHLDTLVINGAECEPFITCDDVLMRERADEIVKGAQMMREILDARLVLIGIEDNKPGAIEAMRRSVESSEGLVQIVAIPTRYPAGGAKQLIRVLTGIEVPHGERSVDYGVQCFNVATALAIYQAIVLGRPLISRIVTVAGNVQRPRNFEALIGTPMDVLVALCDALPDTDRLIMGGPMMGLPMPGDEVPVVKATNCILVGSKALFPPAPPEMPCIRCGDCAKACPADLQPFELYWFSRAKQFGRAQEYKLFDCIECGCCAYVCPSHIPLVDYYRFAKSEIWARESEKASADDARDRHEFRQIREQRDQMAKASRQAAKTTSAIPAAATIPGSQESPTASPDQDAKKALIAAAMARARKQQAAAAPENMKDLSPGQLADIDSIETRRAEIREIAKPHLPPDT